MRAVSLWRPWPWTFIHATPPKRIENRKKPLPKTFAGEIIALHACQSWDSERWPLIQRLAPAIPASPDSHPIGVFAVAMFSKNITESDDPWWLGPNAWVIDGFISLEPVFCKGQQGVWMLDKEVEDIVVQRAVAALDRSI